jgi:hypothetical protein
VALGLEAGTLAINFASGLELRLAGVVTGTGQIGDPGMGAGNPADNGLLTAGPVTIGGAAGFGFTRHTVDMDSDGDGSVDLTDAALDAFAISLTDAFVDVAGVATLTVSGDLAVARVTPAGAGSVRYTALKMGEIVVSASTADAGDFGLTGALTISRLDYNGV